MTKLITFALFFISICFAENNLYHIYDANGKNVASAETKKQAENRLLELQKSNPSSQYFFRGNRLAKISKGVQPKVVFDFGHTRYIEVEKNSDYKICTLEKKAGYWTSHFPFELENNKCFHFETPNYTGSFLFVFFNDSIPLDSVWLLSNQKLVDLSKGKHSLWNIDSITGSSNKPLLNKSKKNFKIDKILVVDKTEATGFEIDRICNLIGANCSNCVRDNSNNSFPRSPSCWVAELYANARSQREGLNISYKKDSYSTIEKMFDMALDSENPLSRWGGVLDTNSNGYRLPFYDEWRVLRHGGQNAEHFYWGISDDSVSISRYEWFMPLEPIHAVGELLPNPYGLYDAMGNALELNHVITNDGFDSRYECSDLQDANLKECLIKNKLYQQELRDGCSLDYSREDWEHPVKRCKSYYVPKKKHHGFRLVRVISINK